MRFQVPQFIEVEDKIFGPLSFRQFAYLAGGAGFCVILYTYGGFFFAALLGLPFLVLAVALAFYRFNNQPFSYLLQSFLMYSINKKLYLWMHRVPNKSKKTARSVPAAAKPYVPKVAANKLKDIAWSLDIKESMYQNESEVK